MDYFRPKRFLLLMACVVAVVLAPAMSAVGQQANAWQINDNLPSVGIIEYFTNLTAGQVSAAMSNGWHYSLLSRILSDAANPQVNGMAFGNGARLFYIYFDLDASGNLTAQLQSSSNVTYTLSLAPPDILKYHLHEMIYNPATSQATYRFDGRPIATWSGDTSTSFSNQVMWGANSPPGRGAMNYHRAEFSVTGLGAVAKYDAGFAGSPPAAPSPTNQGWSRFAGGFAISESAVSPDAEFIHPAAATGVATLRPGQATLNAIVNPNGWPASAWLEHGPTTSYGTVTPIVALGNGNDFIAISSLVTGLPRGTNYHFRVVASNSAGLVFGNDSSFTVQDSPPISSGPSGGGQAFDLRQPSLELNYIICTNGIYPSRDGSFTPPFLGEVRLFAGKFAPAGWSFCNGQLLNITGNEALFSLFGTSYNGDGVTNFGLPDLRMRTVVGTGQGPGLSPFDLGEQLGSTQMTFSVTQIPSHTHSLLPPLGVSGPTGGSQPRLNRQPSLGLSCLIFLEGYYPLTTQTVFEPFLGQMPMFAGNFGGAAALASGQLQAVNQNEALFAVIGTNFGGDGQTTFELPDLRGRSPLGSGQGPGLTARSVGQNPGSEIVTLSVPQLPVHQHTVSLPPPFGYVTGASGSNQPQTLIQPSLVLQCLIATNGEVPSTTTQATNKMVGEIQLFAGTGVPVGWMPCNGQLLQVTSCPALFSVISNNFGGDGITTFALPDLSGRIPVGSLTGQPGPKYGAEQAAMTLAQMPSHTHSVPALDFDRWITFFGLSGANAAFDADADGDGVKNGFEWATGSNPTNAASVNRLQITPAGDTVQIQFNRNTNATDVNFLLQRTTNVLNANGWTGIVTNVAGLWHPPTNIVESGTNPVSVSVSVARTNVPAADYRLKIEWP